MKFLVAKEIKTLKEFWEGNLVTSSEEKSSKRKDRRIPSIWRLVRSFIDEFRS